MNKDNFYLLDTNSLKDFLSFQIKREDLLGWKIFCTSVQKIELERIKNINIRKTLLNVIQEINPEPVISPAGYYGLSSYGFCLYPTPENTITLDQLKQEIKNQDQKDIDEGKKKKTSKTQEENELNWGADAMVLQAALSLGKNCIVITSDKSFKKVCNYYSIQNTKPITFLKMITNKKKN